MKRTILLPLLLVVLFGGAKGQFRKQRLFKVDPASGLFKELRVSVEHRIWRDYFIYIAPNGYHHQWRGRANDRFGKPDIPQKYYGIGLRVGARRYFFPQEKSPQGFFVQAMAGWRNLWVHNYSPELQITSKVSYWQMGFGGTVGYQWLYGPKKNFAYGFMGGLEYYMLDNIDRRGAIDRANIVQNWYDFPFFGQALQGLRVYLGIELGFAFLQKHLHW